MPPIGNPVREESSVSCGVDLYFDSHGSRVTFKINQ